MKKIHYSSLISFFLLIMLLLFAFLSIADDSHFCMVDWKSGKGGPSVINIQAFLAVLLSGGL